MKVLIFGATGMVGQGVLRACLAASDVDHVLSIGRTPLGVNSPKLTQLILSDLYDYSSIRSELENVDACFFCLGISSLGTTESEYDRVTYQLTMAAAQTVAISSPQTTFVFVSGAGADDSEKGRLMWARIKGKTENALQRLPFKAVYIFRPGIIQPRFGQRSKTVFYRISYVALSPVLTVIRWAFPNLIVTTQTLGNAMLNVARHGARKSVLEGKDINEMGQ